MAAPVGHLQPNISPGYGFTAIIVAFLGRLNPVGILIAGLFLALTFIGGEQRADLDQGAARPHQGVPGHPAVLRARLRLADPLSHPPGLSPAKARPWSSLEAIILAVLAASTPLLLAAAGELVAERAGVLNLGVEGMMIMGAACGFAGAYLDRLDADRRAVRHSSRGAALSAVFAALTLGLAVNQVATGLALTILGVGLSGLIGAGFVGERITGAANLYIPVPDRPSVRRPHPVRAGCLRLSLARAGRRRSGGSSTARAPGLVLRAVGDNHTSAHALGYPVLRIRLLAVLFGGACAGLAGAYLPLAYTPFWVPGMTAGRGWIALALVVFASWLPGRLVVGAYLFGAVTILQLHAQGAGLGIPSQLMSSLPYLATIIVLVVISRRARRPGQPGARLARSCLRAGPLSIVAGQCGA